MKINLKPNEQVIKAGNAKLLLDNKISVKIIYTTQNRLYIINQNDIMEFDKTNVKDILYFNRNFLLNDGVNIITLNSDYKLLVKKRKDWEILFGKLY